MNLQQLTYKIKLLQKEQLLGLVSHKKLAPKFRMNEIFEQDQSNAKISAVLLLLYPENGNILMPFIKRPTDGTLHSGQIAFPGGKTEKTDKNHYDTATRETYEEIGIPQKEVEFLNYLSPLFIPVSNFLVMPVIGVLQNKPKFVKNVHEVDEIFTVSIEELLNFNAKNKEIEVRGNVMNVPVFEYKNHTIWGATAMILSEFIDILKK